MDQRAEALDVSCKYFLDCMSILTVVTGNPNKAKEIGIILGQEVTPHKLDIPDLQSFVLRTVVEAKARAAWEQLKMPLLVEDVSFALDGMKGFPGTFVKFGKITLGMMWRQRLLRRWGMTE